jgi:hypothetical protein
LGRSKTLRTGSPQVGNPSHQCSTLIDPNEPTTYYNDSPEENTIILKQTFAKYDRDGANSLAEGELKSVFRYVGWITDASDCADMIQHYDQYGTGSIEYDDFLTDMLINMRHPNLPIVFCPLEDQEKESRSITPKRTQLLETQSQRGARLDTNQIPEETPDVEISLGKD